MRKSKYYATLLEKYSNQPFLQQALATAAKKQESSQSQKDKAFTLKYVDFVLCLCFTYPLQSCVQHVVGVSCQTQFDHCSFSPFL